jgi:phosphate transport system substrate-binding protein
MFNTSVRQILTVGALAAMLCVSACGGSAPAFNAESEIAVVSREDGSGTRGAFVELFGIEVKGADGGKKDTTTKEAVIAKQTDVMMANIAGNANAIGYISLGSLNDSVKAVKIDGAQASAANVESGAYKAARPFFVATKGAANEVTQDFLNFIMSAEGQALIAKSYSPVNAAAAPFETRKPTGKVVVAGSSSVTPVMEKLKEAYNVQNPYVNIEIQQSDSSAGLRGAISGVCDVAMASRALKDAELKELTATQIALDGIAVIVNKSNPVNELSSKQVKEVFTGAVSKWNEL